MPTNDRKSGSQTHGKYGLTLNRMKYLGSIFEYVAPAWSLHLVIHIKVLEICNQARTRTEWHAHWQETEETEPEDLGREDKKGHDYCIQNPKRNS